MICRANQLTGFYMMATFAFNELISPHRISLIIFSVKIRNFFRPKKLLITYNLTHLVLNIRSSYWRSSVRKGVLRNFVRFTGKHLRQSLAQVFSCEFCEISKNTFSYKTPPVAASGIYFDRIYTVCANFIAEMIIKSKIMKSYEIIKNWKKMPEI